MNADERRWTQTKRAVNDLFSKDRFVLCSISVHLRESAFICVQFLICVIRPVFKLGQTSSAR